MTKTMMLWCGAGALCMSLAVSGCSNGSSSGGPASPQPLADPAGRSMTAPVVLNVWGPNPMPAGGNITIDADITVNEPLRVPVTLQVRVPQGATIVGGQPNEVLNNLQPGRIHRQFVVSSAGPLSAPVVVTIDGRAPNGAYGFHGERTYPPPATPATFNPPMRPPVARPPGPAR